MKGSIETVKIEWSHLALGVAMLVFPFFCLFIWLSCKIGMGKATAVFGMAICLIAWLITGAVLTARGFKKG